MTTKKFKIFVHVFVVIIYILINFKCIELLYDYKNHIFMKTKIEIEFKIEIVFIAFYILYKKFKIIRFNSILNRIVSLSRKKFQNYNLIFHTIIHTNSIIVNYSISNRLNYHKFN